MHSSTLQRLFNWRNISFKVVMTVKFGIQIEPQFGFSYEQIRNIAETALVNGINSVWFSDHFMLNADATDRVLLDPWLVMTLLGRELEDLRVGSLVFCNMYRQPALTAKMAATLDVLTEGRLEFGIGAGWKEIEFKAYGYGFPSAIERINRLAEAIQIIRGAWTNERFTFKGEYYTTENLISFPKPVQKPHPTIWVGTMRAKPKMLNLIARFGDGINIAWSYTAEDCKKIFDTLDDMIRRHGRRPSDVKRSVGFWTRVFSTRAEMESQIEKSAKERGVPVETYRQRVESSLWGTVDDIADRLKQFSKLGVSYTILMFSHGSEMEQIQMLARGLP